ncbi:carotenoid oxygenase family protein [Calothrix sp. FACHB-1219]|uniref:carotenoid oxygenase family protein n=1 Tax=unclassified Calothrix TaxID=2619626 RepID=UPI00168427B8|nr:MULTISPECIES: carotenoid oxygenase family protein [unclassified Calothrix]MBD2206233.1 carotenoid oxygenase family protein [Calothrix sp. FACHB-168]MBD2219129.1 carotenoid oxygenase family protein [Calothrix sp. FACHB-1219]
MVQASPKVPLSIMNANRDELPDLTMQIAEGNLPNDLQGHVFLVAPAGTIDSKELPYKNGNTCLNGDGMIYRFDFNQPGEVKWKQRLAKPLDYIFDKKTQNIRKPFLGKLFRFHNHGLIRFSVLLGSRNELNTGFLPMKFPGESNERLLVTYDAGRPYEVDTQTLELVTPVGKLNEWEGAIDFPIYPFKPILSTAHPVFDTYKHEMFTVNYARTLSQYLKDIIRNLNAETEKQQEPEKYQRLSVICELLEQVLHGNFWNNDFVHLMRWDGKGELKKWQLFDPDNSPITIKQSMHQIGLTEDYIVLMDTAFTTGIEQILTNIPDIPLIDERKLVRVEPLPDSIIYIIRRDDLQEGKTKVVAQKIVIPLEAAHFLLDYENPGNKITLHAAHICAWDVAEWLRQSDRSPYDTSQPVSPNLSGTQQSPMDISRMGRYVIDVDNLSVKEKKVISDRDCTWGAGLFTYLDRLPSSGMTPKKLDNIYWVSFGLWEELTTESMREQYEDYRNREVPLDEVLQLAKEGKPSCLFRLNTASNESMRIEDYYKFPQGHIALSPQFIPRSVGEESSTNGYIMCTVFTPERDEIWIFDAKKLNAEPLCKLYHPQLNFGLSLHTTWLQNLSPAQDKYRVPDEKDDINWALQQLLKFVDSLSSLDEVSVPRGGQDLKTEMKEEIQNLFQ